jgi:hypothetical protein
MTDLSEAIPMCVMCGDREVQKSPLGHITTIGQLFEIIDWDFDGAGLTVTDGAELANAIANRFPYLTNDMPHSVKEIE